MITCSLALAASTQVLHGQARGGPPDGRQQASLVYVHQFDADLDRGGEVAVDRLSLNYGIDLFGNRQQSAGLTLSYSADAFSFNGTTGLAGLDPWDTIHTLELGLGYRRALNEDWTFFASPSIGSSGEGSFDGDSLRYSIVAGASTNLSDNLTLGFGLVATTGLEETQLIPFLSVRWQFAERWFLQNPFRPGPSGPAGLEVAYIAETWQVALGGGYRSYRFQFDQLGGNLEPIAEYQGVPVFLRYTQNLTPRIALDLYAGAVFGGSIEIEDADGNNIGLDDDFDTAPLLAASISGRF